MVISKIQALPRSQNESRLTETRNPETQVWDCKRPLSALSVQVTELIGSHVVTPAGGARRLIERDVCG